MSRYSSVNAKHFIIGQQFLPGARGESYDLSTRKLERRKKWNAAGRILVLSSTNNRNRERSKLSPV